MSRANHRVATALLMMLAATACSPSPEVPSAKPIPEVAVVTLKSQSLPLSTTLPGRTVAYQLAEVRPQVSGIIQKRLFTEGDSVKAGTPLYQIDAASYQASLDSAKGSLARAQALQTQAQLKAERAQALADIKAISQQELEDAQASAAEARANVTIASAALATARVNLDYTQVRAPISGRIGKSSVTPGALVTANQANLLTTIQQLDPIYVDVTQSTAELLTLQRAIANGRVSQASSAKVTLTLDDGSTYSHTGKLTFADALVDPSTNSVTLRALFPNPERELLPGMYVQAHIAQGTVNNALLAPQPGISRNARGEATALVVDDKQQVQPRQVTVDRTVGDQWLVTDGLKAGDRLIVQGLQKVKPGAQVRAVELAATATPSTEGP